MALLGLRSEFGFETDEWIEAERAGRPRRGPPRRHSARIPTRGACA